jgi:hypothetical protein
MDEIIEKYWKINIKWLNLYISIVWKKNKR